MSCQRPLLFLGSPRTGQWFRRALTPHPFCLALVLVWGLIASSRMAWAQSLEEDPLVEKARQVLLEGKPLGKVLADYPFATGLSWRVANIASDRVLVEAACRLDPKALGMVSPQERDDKVSRMDRIELVVTFVADSGGVVALHALHLYIHCAKGRFKAYPLPKTAPQALVEGIPLPRILLDHSDKELFICQDW